MRAREIQHTHTHTHTHTLTIISRHDYWSATVPNEACYGEGSIACEMFVAFCQPLPPSIGSACYGASICQVGTDSEGGAHAYSMGQFKNSVRFVPSKMF